MQADRLAERVIELAHELHPYYTHEQALVWALGFLGTVVCEKNLMDSIVFDRLNSRINTLRDSKE